MNRRDAVWVTAVVAATALAWTGFFIHNLADLPRQSILSPESLYPTLVWIAALVLWLAPATQTAGAWALVTWAGINLVGGAASVLPLPFLPFEPEQAPTHYAFHGLYAAAQLPLIGATAVWFSRGARSQRNTSSNSARRCVTRDCSQVVSGLGQTNRNFTGALCGLEILGIERRERGLA